MGTRRDGDVYWEAPGQSGPACGDALQTIAYRAQHPSTDHGNSDARRPPAAAFWLVAGVVLALAVLRTAAGGGLYADGSYLLLRTLEKQSFHSELGTLRFHVTLLQQLPTLSAIWLGARDIKQLTLLYSASLVLLPVAFWLAAFHQLRRDELFWPFVLLFAVVYFHTNLFSIGEYNLGYAHTALALAIIVRREPLSLSNGLLLVALASLSLRIYEAAAFLAPLLAIACLLRARTLLEDGGVLPAGCACMASGIFLASAIVAAGNMVWTPLPENRSQAADLSILMTNKQLSASLAVAVLYSVFMSTRARAVLMLSGPMAFVALFAVIWFAQSNEPWMQYLSRGVAGLFMLGFGTLLTFRGLRGSPHGTLKAPVSGLLAAIPLTLLAILSAGDAGRSLGLHAFIADFREVINSSSGPVRLEDTALARSAYGWAWTYPSLSILLRTPGSGAIVLDPESYSGWRPFDPKGRVPDLSRYHR